MIKKKICMLGAFAVGKTSLIQRFVNSIFSEKYHTTIGVKIDQKSLIVDGKEVSLILWDIHGEDEFQKINPSYLTGASGYFLVMDGTRYNTLNVAMKLRSMAVRAIGNAPFVILINKSDLKQDWEISNDEINALVNQNITVIETSAKEDYAVDEAFRTLAKLCLNK